MAGRLDHLRCDDGPAVHEIGLHGGGSEHVARGRYVPGGEDEESGITRIRRPSERRRPRRQFLRHSGAMASLRPAHGWQAAVARGGATPRGERAQRQVGVEAAAGAGCVTRPLASMTDPPSDRGRAVLRPGSIHAASVAGPRKDRAATVRGPWKCRATTVRVLLAGRQRGGKTIAPKGALPPSPALLGWSTSHRRQGRWATLLAERVQGGASRSQLPLSAVPYGRSCFDFVRERPLLSLRATSSTMPW